MGVGVSVACVAVVSVSFKKGAFLLLFAQCPRALTPLGLKETETTATQARDSAIFNLNFEQTPILGLTQGQIVGLKTKSKQAGKEKKLVRQKFIWEKNEFVWSISVD